jgi:head-tail adaptor
MRDKINVQSATLAVDDNGQPIATWANVLYREPAQWIPTTGGETLRGKQVEAQIRAVFIVRYRARIYDVEQRVVHNSKTYGIANITEVSGRTRYLQLECRAINPDVV